MRRLFRSAAKGTRDRRDLSGFVFWILFSLWAVHSSLQLGLGALRNPGPGFFPFCAAVGLAVFAGLHVPSSTRENESFLSRRAGGKGARAKTPLAVIAALLLYCLIIEKLGYLLATTGLMAALFSLGRMKVRALVIGSLTASLFSYLLFTRCLGTPLPKGILPF